MRQGNREGATTNHREQCASSCASPTAAEEAGGAQKEYTNQAKPPSGKGGRRLGAGALLDATFLLLLHEAKSPPARWFDNGDYCKQLKAQNNQDNRDAF